MKGLSANVRGDVWASTARWSRTPQGAWSRYLTEDDPARHAGLVVRFDHPDRPALR